MVLVFNLPDANRCSSDVPALAYRVQCSYPLVIGGRERDETSTHTHKWYMQTKFCVIAGVSGVLDSKRARNLKPRDVHDMSHASSHTKMASDTQEWGRGKSGRNARCR